MTIRVGARPASLGALGTYLDGVSADAQPVRLRIEESIKALVIESSEGPVLWPLGDIRQIPDQAGKDQLVLSLNSDPVARLITDEQALVARCPNLHARRSTVNRKRIFTFALGALASVALIILVLVPKMADQLAVFIPPEGEKALGEATLHQIQDSLSGTGVMPIRQCNSPEGIAALKIIRDRLEAHADLPVDLSVHVLDHRMVNAFALPGGHVVFFRGLINHAERPEELAAVFAHEIGHVVSRDPTRHALRSAGSIGVLGLLFGDFAGGAVVLFMTEQLIQAQYSQAAEADADAFATGVLQNAGIAPSALGDMFSRLLEGHESSDNGIVALFLSHPDMRARIEASQKAHEAAEVGGFAAQPLMTEAEWQSLKDICKKRR
jgi:Zn-dependent protease with chaperone function